MERRDFAEKKKGQLDSQDKKKWRAPSFSIIPALHESPSH